MKLMAEGWTEERLDDLKGQVERLERRTDEGLRSLRAEMDRRFDQAEAQIDARFKTVDRHFGGIDRRFGGIDRRFEEIDHRLDGIDHRLDGIDHRLEGIDRRFEALDGHLYAMHRTLALFLGSMFAALLGFLATQL